MISRRLKRKLWPRKAAQRQRARAKRNAEWIKRHAEHWGLCIIPNETTRRLLQRLVRFIKGHRPYRSGWLPISPEHSGHKSQNTF